MSIGANIRRLRSEHNLSQKELAQIAGVTDKAVSTWETGKKDPRMGAIEKIASHFGIRKSAIIEDTPHLSFTVSPSERAHIEKYRAISDEHREAVDVQLDFFYKKDTENFVKKESPSSGQGEADAG